ncbi:hypothetical protein [Streptomyces anulatus]|uniref:hypothetical protein n=1 Tax=Streptomyces anulatus TaxID=1892 RepID=UPI0027E2255C|nr:hypothetical protein [Streptomyces anulatus]
MTRTEPSAPGVRPEQEALFSTGAEHYTRHRPGLPDPAVHLLAGTLAGRTAPALLDLGTGTGQVPRALLAVRDLVRLSDAWAGRTDLYTAFLDGYGRHLTDLEEAPLVIDQALDAVSGIAYGSTGGDPELVERGRRMLARLRAKRIPPFTTGDLA